ncbi:MAG: succinate dehydrogenase cytochrome b subunit [Chloroflexi bacterium]|nr:succinate dehydrogenase cytochrome b subunit [Chloroflexota bacterium]
MKIIFLQSSLGKKYVMAVTGFALFGFVIMHMLGNLQIFLGPNQINRYAQFLQSNVELVWAARLGLLLMVALHVISAILVSLENKAARPVPYGDFQAVASSYASRTMLMSGVIIAVFVIYHLLHYTVQVQSINLTGQDFKHFDEVLAGDHKRHDVYRMMIVGFSNLWVSGFYVLGMALLALHLSHGASSMFQSIGWKNGKYGRWIDRLACLAALVIFLGYCSIPVAVLTGILKEIP